MKRLVVLAVLGIIAASTAYGAVHDVYIESFHIRMKVLEDNSYIIQETLDVHFLSAYRHGIFRDIPRTSRYGTPVRITNIEVPGYPVNQSREGDFLRLRIGDPERYAAARELYRISYRYHIGDDLVPEYDELYFNLIGLDWEMPIHSASFEIVMPKPFDPQLISFTYGREGSTMSEAVSYTVEGNVITGTLDYRLSPGEGLTIALPLPQGYYSIVARQRARMDILAALLPWAFIAAAAFSLMLYAVKGRNRKLIPAVEFYPPRGLNPAEVGYLYDNRVDPYDITSLLIYWADLGLMKIIQETKKTGLLRRKKAKTYLQKMRDIPSGCRAYEQRMFNALFKEFGTSEGLVDVDSLTNKFHKHFAAAKSGLKQHAGRSRDMRIYASKMPVRKWMTVTGLAVMIIGGCFSIYWPVPQLRFWVLLWIPAAVLISALMIAMGEFFHKLSTYRPRDIPMKVILLIIGIAAGAGAAVFVESFWAPYARPLYFAAASALPVFFLVPFAQLRTEEGNRLMEEILGFRMFIKRAEKDRINRMVEEDPAYFYHILPYAMVFGITDKWARQFEHITLEPPDWYVGSAAYFTTRSFCRSLERSSSSMASTMTRTPSSSGRGSSSSSGGSSGGGSGGGGGGAW